MAGMSESEKPPASDAQASGAASSAPLVSVIVPTYNNADTLHACLDAVLNQTVPPGMYEVIVVDDGSGDATAAAVAAYVGRATPVRYIHQRNQGPAAARNRGAREARGDLLLFTDDDCEPTPTWIAEMTKPFRNGGREVAAVKGAYRTRQTSVIAIFAQKEFESRYRRMLDSDAIDFVDTYSAAFRRSVFLALGGFDTRFPKANNEDVEFSYRMAERGHRMVFNPDAIVYHRHPDTLMRYLKVKFGRAYWRMAVYRLFPEKMKGDSYTPHSLKLQVALALALLATLAAAPFDRRYLWGSGALTAAFLLTCIPFLVGLLDIPILHAAARAMKRFMKRGFIRSVLRSLSASFLGRGARALGRALAAGARALLGALRIALHSAPVRIVFGAVRTSLRWLAYEAVPGIALAIGRAARAVGSAAKAIALAPPRALAALFGSAPARAIGRAFNWLATTRLMMIPVSMILLLLRGIVMGLGTLWGLRPPQRDRGRFSYVFIMVLCDLFAVFLACAATDYTGVVLFRVFGSSTSYPIDFYMGYLPAIGLFLLAIFFLSGLYRPYRGFSRISEFVILTKSVAVTTGFVMLGLYLTSSPHSKSVVLLTSMYTLVFVALGRWIGRALHCSIGRGREDETRTRTLIVGTQEIARLIARRLKSGLGLEEAEVVGFVDENAANVGTSVEGEEVIGTLDDLGRIIEDQHVEEVFLALPMMPHKQVIDLINRHSNREGVHFYIVSNLFELISAEVDLAEHSSIPLAHLRNENMELLPLMLKRVFDVAVSAAVILLALPFWLLIMVAIRLETEGPAIFKQERVGRNGRVFLIFKFRTMFIHTPKFAYSPSDPADTRITKVGRFLRRTSLDEFPQCFNVLRGEMSLVGPRPEMPFLVAKYNDWERQRLKVKPGLTGLWQIMGRKDLPLHESLEYDFYYIKNQSLLLDLTILLKTIPVVLRGKGAY